MKDGFSEFFTHKYIRSELQLTGLCPARDVRKAFLYLVGNVGGEFRKKRQERFGVSRETVRSDH